MVDDFYNRNIPKYIGLKSDFIKLHQYIKKEHKEYFELNFTNEFKEGKTIIHWDY